ncbi:hypothetical protein ACB087_14685 [Vibrio sp. VNB-15]
MYGENNLSASSSSQAKKRKNDASNTSQDGSATKRSREAQTKENADKWAAFQRDWQNHVENKNLTSPDEPAEALIRFNYRYVVNDNTGALKYEPISVDQILNNYDELERVYYRRQIHDPRPIQTRQQSHQSTLPSASHFEVKMEPQSTTGTVLVVPSVGMPKEFKIKEKLEELYWFKEGNDRPVYLFVHQSELNLYHEQMGTQLQAAGVGLVGWAFESGTVGFGATRKAVVDFCKLNQLKKVTMMDCNVLMSEMDLISAAEEATSEVKDDTTLYISLGVTSGDTYEKGSKAPKGLLNEGAVKGRPIEQFTMLNRNVLFDPAFISSSEDIDVSNDMKFFNSINQQKSIALKDLKLHQKLKAELASQYPRINKLRLSPTSQVYNDQFKAHLTQISEKEQDMVIEVKTGTESNVQKHKVTVKALSDFLAEKLGKDALRIQSLIIEKMLVKYKDMSMSSGYQYEAEGLEETKTALYPNEEPSNKNGDV